MTAHIMAAVNRLAVGVIAAALAEADAPVSWQQFTRAERKAETQRWLPTARAVVDALAGANLLVDPAAVAS